MLLLTVTGNIASGKSSLVNFVKSQPPRGAKFLDIDKIVAKLYQDPEIVSKVASSLGVKVEEICNTKTKAVDKDKISKIAFSSRPKRSRLEKVFFRYIHQHKTIEIQKHITSRARCVIVESPLFFEARGWLSRYGLRSRRSIVIQTPVFKMRDNFQRRHDARLGNYPKAKNPLGVVKFFSILRTQMPSGKSIRLADIVCQNFPGKYASSRRFLGFIRSAISKSQNLYCN